ncbi:MAG: adenylate/guanylate cyclase domain-containing protein [Leptospiraceae bacterium]|nr:adenylate/guanylate cyclase domain-containing protein [Leptospiraceae bacterium]MBK7056248.1 adenylate/guanylate cyclase domain-containing protein [Leptospiraceae bacterium]MBK9501502.1 adenylate/guanylate cyclase domain-containing protein [Leptospiraceae bacterium]MBP9162774.1 adenylate/guanylate cyclase domain-containing protein [Leptospiraceae bacterium]
MSEKQSKLSIIDIISLTTFSIGALAVSMSAFLPPNILSAQMSILGVILLLGSFYYVYKFIEKISKEKQVIGSILIAVGLALTIFTAKNILKLMQTAEESSIAWRFYLLKGSPGKGALSSDKGYIEKVNEIEGARKDIRIIGIKTETLEKLQGNWPIDWKKYAELVNAFKGTSNMLLFDIFFVDYKPVQKDAMEAALKGTNNVMFDYSIESTAESRSSVINLDSRIEKLRRFKLKHVKDEDDQGVSWLSFAVPPIEQVTENSAGVGFANIRKEESSSNRHMPLVAKVYNHGPNNETEYYPSIDLIATARFLGVDVVEDTEVVMGKYVKIKNIPKKMIKDKNGEHDIMTIPNPEREIVIPIDIYGQMEINFVGSLFCFRDDDLYDVAEWGKEYATQYSDTIFLVAMYYATGRGASKDTHLSPYGEMSGIEHHAHAINTILNQSFMADSPEGVNLFIFLIVAIIIGFIQPKVKTWFAFIFIFLFVIGYTAISLGLFSKFNLIIPLPSIVIEQLMVFVAIIGFKILTEEANVKYIRNTFSKFVSKDVVDELLRHPEKIALGGAKREITIFFSDIRGFTTLSEALSPEELVKLLNEYLSTMTEIIIECKGTIDKYMGDAIMAFWGAPVDLEDHAYYACVASLIQMDKLAQLQASWKQRNLPSIDIGIGLNTGSAVVGNMGSSQRMDYTCMGDTINLGSRLEGSNKTYGTNIIISEYTFERVKDRVYARELDLVQVKGKTHPVRIYELIGLIDDEDIKKVTKPLVIS